MQYTSKAVYEYISKQTGDPIVERKTCRISGQPFAIFQSDLDFFEKVSPTFNGKKFAIPTPNLCPEERLKRRLIFRNERKFYKRKCDATGKDMVSLYNPDIVDSHNNKLLVYHQKVRWSDQWDPFSYGRDFDSKQTFTEQFRTLREAVPLCSIMNDDGIQSENCAYTNDFAEGKDCYMVSGSCRAYNCMYINGIEDSHYCIDGCMVFNSEQCYECTDPLYCTYCFFCMQCAYSTRCYFSSLLQGCHDCIACIGLSQQQYYIFNIPYSKEEYLAKKDHIIKQLLMHDKASIEQLHLLSQSLPLPASCNTNSINTFGDRTRNSNNAYFCYDNTALADCKYCIGMGNMKDNQDIYITTNANLCYESLGPDYGHHHLFTEACWHGSKNILYSAFCHSCSYCFGCVGLRHQQYCIFNKQYTKEEYEKKVADIIGHMIQTGERGEFFDPSLSPFGYNETVAQEYFPIMAEGGMLKAKSTSAFSVELSAFGYKRSDYSSDPIIPTNIHVIRSGEYSPEQRDQLKSDDNLVNQILICEVSGRPFRIVKAELEFYRKHNLPLPKKHPDIRHEERMQRRPGRTLYVRNCDKCQKQMISVYATRESSLGDKVGTHSNTSVYCESCYQQEVFG